MKKHKNKDASEISTKAMKKHISQHMDLFYSERMRTLAKDLGLEFKKVKKFEYLIRKKD